MSRMHPDCPTMPEGTIELHEGKAHSCFLQSQQPKKSKVYCYEDQVEKSSRGVPLVRTLANVNEGFTIKWIEAKSGKVDLQQPSSNYDLIELRATDYIVLIEDMIVLEHRMRHGGVYTLLITNDNNEQLIAKLYEITEPNSMSILWLIPQYVVMTLGEVMFSVTGLEFSYSQAPVNMKTVLQACWLLTVAFGNVIVVIIAELKFFDSQAYEFFLFAGLMFVDMLLFMWTAYRYVPNDPDKIMSVGGSRNLNVEAERDKQISWQPNLPRYSKHSDEE